MEFCYIARRSIFTDKTILQLEEALAKFHKHREIFRTTGVRKDFYPPRQHSLVHYPRHIREFGAPNGLCSSITESKHIKAIKEPYRRSSRFEALGQMLLINQRLDKLAAARVDFEDRGMLHGSLFMSTVATYNAQGDTSGESLMHQPQQAGYNEDMEESSESEEDSDREEQADKESTKGNDATGSSQGAWAVVEGPRVEVSVKLARRRSTLLIPLKSAYILLLIPPVYRLPTNLRSLGNHFDIPHLENLAAILVHNQLHPQTPLNAHDPPPSDIQITKPVSVFASAVSTFYAPSDLSGINGMHRERIRTTKSWRSGASRYDCVFIEKDRSLPGFRGLHAARVRLFLSFVFQDVSYPCALVEWFTPVGNEPDPLTGLWVVEPDFEPNGRRSCELVHLDTVIRSAHLIGVYGPTSLPRSLRFSDSLDAFKAFYVNKYADHHAHEIAF